ncbi:MAG: sensor histidine kinase [Verrucomicrobia bacterium]|jgi:signal transduction histidine kinase|nr:sensor histidine kinase [Verrucomicrobiota bacterium]
MHEVEIPDLPPLKPNEQSLLEMHSLLNIFNVLRGELALIGLQAAGNDELLFRGLAVCDELISALCDPAASLSAARATEDCIAAIRSEIEGLFAQRPALSGHPEVSESVANLETVFAILRVRAGELLARAQWRDRWTEFSVSSLLRDFQEVFSAIEKNSRGRFRIIYNAATQQPQDYYVDFKIESIGGDRIWMPPGFKDVMRDLIANARKYTPPGGHITAAAHESAGELRFVVEDTGRGIPREEIGRVVQFGQRASNVGDVRTMGGGFGLTKAVFITKRFGGRLWIASEVGRGTRIRILLPRPPAAELVPAPSPARAPETPATGAQGSS